MSSFEVTWTPMTASYRFTKNECSFLWWGDGGVFSSCYVHMWKTVTWRREWAQSSGNIRFGDLQKCTCCQQQPCAVTVTGVDRSLAEPSIINGKPLPCIYKHTSYSLTHYTVNSAVSAMHRNICTKPRYMVYLWHHFSIWYRMIAYNL